MPPGTSRAPISADAGDDAHAFLLAARACSVSRASGSSPRSGASLRSTIVTSTPRRLSACANSHAIGPAPPIDERLRQVGQAQQIVARQVRARSRGPGSARSTGRAPDGEHRRDAAQLASRRRRRRRRARRRGSARARAPAARRSSPAAVRRSGARRRSPAARGPSPPGRRSRPSRARRTRVPAGRRARSPQP